MFVEWHVRFAAALRADYSDGDALDRTPQETPFFLCVPCVLHVMEAVGRSEAFHFASTVGLFNRSRKEFSPTDPRDDCGRAATGYLTKGRKVS